MCDALRELIEKWAQNMAQNMAQKLWQEKLIELVRDNLLALEEAAIRAGISREEFVKRLEAK